MRSLAAQRLPDHLQILHPEPAQVPHLEKQESKIFKGGRTVRIVKRIVPVTVKPAVLVLDFEYGRRARPAVAVDKVAATGCQLDHPRWTLARLSVRSLRMLAVWANVCHLELFMFFQIRMVALRQIQSAG